MSGGGIRWQQARSISRRSPGSIGRGGIPTDPGVYIWFKNDEPIYVGEARGKKGLRGRIRSHRATDADLSRSTLRASVAVDQLGVERTYARQRPSVMTKEQIVAVNEWLAGCEIGWIVCSSEKEAHELEVSLRDEWLPPLNRV